ncbi:hypothetical protein LUCX_88 [Xanthomonas phage vB_XciM_LucasX]|nr:hypothetical protein LUCX_88 [Xanthomonas phage vB_XciM_LucasX]
MRALGLALEALRSDSAELRQLEYQLQLAQELQRQLETQRGVGRHDIQVAMESFGLELGPYYPINSFTLQPSLTNYTVTQEGLKEFISQTISKIIKAIFAAISDLLRIVIEGDETYNVAETEKQLETLRKISTLRYNWDELIAQGKQGPTDELRSKSATLERLLLKFEDISKLEKDALSEGSIIAKVRAFDEKIAPWIQEITAQFNALNKALKSHQLEGLEVLDRDAMFVRMFQAVMDVLEQGENIEGAKIGLETLVSIVARGNAKINQPLYESAPKMVGNVRQLAALTKDVEHAIKRAEESEAGIIREQLGQIATDLNRIRRYLRQVKQLHQIRVKWIGRFVEIYQLAAEIRKQLQWTA